ncbi:MAG: phospho-N-acetylmuramoyl-pentapeptide-transferase [Actinobacteria bacterium]|nr:phospho-N-acetylmuramoyl-pentapeptide-transferase [Actinomycetota bacterium]
MVRVLVAAVIAMLIAIILGPRFIAFLRRNAFGQHIREDGPEHHVVKQGTPVMGGVLIMIAASVGFLAMSRYTLPALTVFGVTLACATIGFVDDFIKLTHRRSLGLSGRWKLLLLAGVTVGLGFAVHDEHFRTNVYFPIVDVRPNLWWFWYLLIFLMLAGAANGVNLTDGIDGLAAGTGIIALVCFTAINVLTYIRTGSGDPNSLDLAILGGALAGASIGFLWFNAFPAEVFMGDTGSMGIGGALGAFAVFSKTEVLLLVVGGIFLIEALSVILQVATFKFWGRRVFLMAPIHHHFEMKAWSETKIMVRFWIVAAILAAGAFATYYQYFFDFHPELFHKK